MFSAQNIKTSQGVGKGLFGPMNNPPIVIVVGVDVVMYDNPNGMSFVQLSFRRGNPCVYKF